MHVHCKICRFDFLINRYMQIHALDSFLKSVSVSILIEDDFNDLNLYFQVCAESTTVIGKVFALIHAKEESDASRKIKRRCVSFAIFIFFGRSKFLQSDLHISLQWKSDLFYDILNLVC